MLNIKRLLLACMAASIFIGCGSDGGSSSNGSSPNTQSIAFDSAGYGVTNGSTNKAIVSLTGTPTTQGQTVTISSSNPSVAVVEKNECVLANAPGYVNSCEVRIKGVSSGAATLNAAVTNNQSMLSSIISLVKAAVSSSSSTITPINAAISVSDAPVAGTLSFANSNFNIVAGQENKIRLSLNGSSGIKNSMVTIISNNPNITLKTTKCFLSTNQNFCDVFLTSTPAYVGSTGSIGASMTEANNNYKTLTANAQANIISSQEVLGTLSFNANPVINYNNYQTQVLELSLNNSSNVNGISVTFNINGNAVEIPYGGGGCTLSTAHPTCTLGLKAANIGTTTITANVTNAAGYTSPTSIVTVNNGSPTPKTHSLIFSQSTETMSVGATSQSISVTTNNGSQPEINFSVDNPSIASINTGKANPNKCDANEPCNLQITGASAGVAKITASATGYSSATNSITVNSAPTPQPNYGTLDFNQTQYQAKPGATKYITVGLNNSSGVNGVNITFTAPSGITIDSNQTCVLSTQSPNCTVQAQVASNASGSYTITAQSTQAIGLSANATIEVSQNAQKGVVLSTSMVAFPYGYNYATTPQQTVYVSLEGLDAKDKSQSYKVYFDTNLSIWQTSDNPPTSPDGQHFIKLNSDNNFSGYVTLVPQSTSGNKGVYQINFYVVDNNFSSPPPYCSSCPSGTPPPALGFSQATLTAVIAKATMQQRTITVVNNCPFTVYPAMSGGATWFTLSTPPTLGGYCDDTNSSIYSGESNASNSTYQCYWVNPTPTNGSYKLGVDQNLTFVIPVGTPDYKRNGWSGGITARALSDDGKTWLLGDCSGNNRVASPNPSTEGCGVSYTYVDNNTSLPKNGYGQVGFSSPTTNGEITLSSINPDAFDIQAITGVGIPISMQPTGLPYNQTTPYFNGAAGGVSPQKGNGSTLSYNLGASTWTFTEPSATTGIFSGAYNYVSGTVASNTPCSTSTPCSSGLVCGYTYDAFNGPSANYQTTCGYRLAYLSPDAVWKGNPDTNLSSQSNKSPFNFYQSAGASGSVNLNLSNFYECQSTPNVIQSAYQTSTPSNACGGVVWPSINVQAPATSPLQNTNTYWVTNVLPNITWIKAGCPTCYSYPYDDMSSSFQGYNMMSQTNPVNNVGYTITLCPANKGLPNNYWQKTTK